MTAWPSRAIEWAKERGEEEEEAMKSARWAWPYLVGAVVGVIAWEVIHSLVAR